ncbi:MAG: SCP2 sterol-binding domain-containing protein [Chloroflexota bacterium]|jgi:putative sterol carrier protein|nr:SCP2 sterol-binding domain-containing protein [Anaerolineae bacterium]HMM29027.1 SCP2 sterol-binding domain-containing protein [Aggregatilineaceae bacterium]
MPRASSLEEIFENVETGFSPEKAEGVNAIFQFNVTGDGGGQYWARIANQQIEVERGEHASPDMIMTATDEDFLALFNGELNPMMAFMQGKIKVKGEMALALKLQMMLGLA